MWSSVLAYTSWGTSLLPLVYFISMRGSKLNTILKNVLLLKGLSFLIDGACLVLNQYNIPNSALINVYVSLEFLILLKIYHCFFERERWRWVFKLLSAGLIIFVIYLLVIKNNLSSFSSQLNTFSAIAVVVLSVIAFSRLIEQCQQSEVTRHYFFWINSAFMLYYLCNLALFLFKAQILGAGVGYDTSRIWGAHNFFHVCSNVMILIGFVVWRKQSSSSTLLSGS